MSEDAARGYCGLFLLAVVTGIVGVAIIAFGHPIIGGVVFIAAIFGGVWAGR